MAEPDSPQQFQLDVSVPRDERFVPTVRDLAVQGARFAGCTPEAADAFGKSVEAALGTCLHTSTSEIPIAVVVRRNHGPLEVLVDEHTLTLDV
jgi:hypothetical protein